MALRKWLREIIKAIEAEGIECRFLCYTGKDHFKFEVRRSTFVAFIVTSNSTSDEKFALKKIVADAKRHLRQQEEKQRVVNSTG